MKIQVTIRYYDAFSAGTGEYRVRTTEQSKIVEFDIPDGAKIADTARVGKVV
jgi:hypothetical protein